MNHTHQSKYLFFLLLLAIDLLGPTASMRALPHRLGQTFTMADGLSNGFVADIALDGHGFVWAATESGLNCLAGGKATSFKTTNSDLRTDELVGVRYHAKSNTVWSIGKNGMLDVFHCATRRFSRPLLDGKIPTDIVAVGTASDGGLWLAHYGGEVHHLDPLTGKSWRVPRSRLPRIRDGVRTVADDGKGHLYIGLRMEGLLVYDLRTHKVRQYTHKTGTQQGLLGNNVRCVFVDHKGRVWLGTNGGLALFDLLKGRFKTFRHEVGNVNSLAGDNVHHVNETRGHVLLVASDIGGVSTLDLNRFDEFHDKVVFGRLTQDGGQLSSNNVRNAVEDAFGNLWVANYALGVDFLPHRQQVFSLLSLNGKPLTGVTGLFCDSHGRLWVNQDNWVTVLLKNGGYRQFDISPHIDNSAAVIYSFCEDPTGNVWMGTSDNGVLKLNPVTGQMVCIPQTRGMDVIALFAGRDGKVWMGTEKGVYVAEHGVVRREEAINRLIGTDAFPSNFCEDRLGRLWIGTLVKGVMVLSKDHRRVTRLKGLPSSSVNQIIQSADGTIWIATHKGLACVSDVKRLGNVKVYDTKQGLADNFVSAIAEGQDESLWMSLHAGLSRFDKKAQRFSNYGFSSGLPMGNFVVASVASMPSGLLLFGSPGGVCEFRPSSFASEGKVSPLAIIDCERLTGENNPAGRHLVEPDAQGGLRLRHDENSIILRFTVSDYSQKGDVEYVYCMKGLDDQWYDTEDKNSVTFRNLAPGNYTFCVRAKLRGQDWKTATMADASIVVSPPLWLTWWAKVVYGLLVAAIVAYVFYSYRQRLLLNVSLDKERWEGKQRQALADERVRFFTNITHELRTPLTLIIGPLEDLISEGKLPQMFVGKVTHIHACALRLLSLVNGILEFQKVETKHRRLSVVRRDLAAMVRSLGVRYCDLNRNEMIKVDVKVPESQISACFDPDIITTVVDNFMSNALKYTPSGTVVLELAVEGHEVMIRVSDTGRGISQEALPHVFDRYYQAGGVGQAPGTGIGLALVKSLAELHDAKLSVRSEEGKGSTFCFSISLDRGYPDALHESEETISTPSEANDLESATDKNCDERELILVVEDHQEVRQYIVESLHDEYRIVEAHQGKDGLDMALKMSPDLIVSDVMMPEMDGVEMTRLLKADMRTSHIPVVLLTAKTSPIDQENGYDSGADSYLTKPFSSRLLRSRVKNILEGRRRLAAFVLDHMEGTEVDVEKDESQKAQSPVTKMMELNPLDKEFLSKLDHLIEENLGGPDMDMSFFTDRMAMSHSTFYRKVKALTGIGANEYVRKIKLKCGMEYLKSGRYNVNEVASLTGFNSPGYFRKCFRKEFGVLPSEVLKVPDMSK